MPESMIVVLVHGWSVTSTDTYGALAQRLRFESQAGRLPELDVRNIWLSRYVSFRDEVRLQDLSRGLDAALRRELGAQLDRGRPLACITHSTGGPVVRDWWHRYFRSQARPCPMTHLVMLAPANFGSALAHLGKERLGQLKSWFQGVEPGTGILDWLDLGSAESWELNRAWIEGSDPTLEPRPVFPFVLTGQTIDRKLYDHANSYTGELGSDGVVRVAAANLNARYVRLVQDAPAGEVGRDDVLRLRRDSTQAPRTAFALIRGCSHSGESKGILRSIRDDGRPHPTISAVLQCLRVATKQQYDSLCDRFDRQTQQAHSTERVEVVPRTIFPDAIYIHDAHAMVTFRIRDDHGYPPQSYDLKLLGRANNPDRLPPRFMADRQRNKRDTGMLTLYLNSDILHGTGPAKTRSGRTVRRSQPGVGMLGLEAIPRPREGYVRYAIGRLRSSEVVLSQLITPDQTTLVDIVLRRTVGRGVYELTRDVSPRSFSDQPTGPPIQ